MADSAQFEKNFTLASIATLVFVWLRGLPLAYVIDMVLGQDFASKRVTRFDVDPLPLRM